MSVDDAKAGEGITMVCCGQTLSKVLLVKPVADATWDQMTSALHYPREWKHHIHIDCPNCKKTVTVEAEGTLSSNTYAREPLTVEDVRNVRSADACLDCGEESDEVNGCACDRYFAEQQKEHKRIAEKMRPFREAYERAEAAELAEFPQSWAEFVWPEWVPTDVRAQIMGSSHYADAPAHANGSRAYGPRAWAKAALENRAPPLGTRVTLSTTFNIPRVVTKTYVGRFVFAWNNMCRVIQDDGTVGYPSFPPMRPSPGIESIKHEEWLADGARRFGNGQDHFQNWRFECPSCRHVQTPTDAKAKFGDSDSAYRRCTACGLATFGLIPCHTLEVEKEGQFFGVFRYAEATPQVIHVGA